MHLMLIEILIFILEDTTDFCFHTKVLMESCIIVILTKVLLGIVLMQQWDHHSIDYHSMFLIQIMKTMTFIMIAKITYCLNQNHWLSHQEIKQ